ncbi:Flp family type IVb pilin [Caballeronia novacaledonica]|uniref:Flp family type IVb pilin n=1 Tax=Caballeronia novacaledonica TaxID=1544861 RepID=A0ACB5QWS8_9BURK|nr:Flp family type IVb pilin [Caballeronia novacaledonica]GJH11912.1 Flp family type IVb pilin [Caballeronia novacaledonica]GJH19270.1 Flp family type IVb pilin [Caballeronia novacaledonica]
MQKLLKAFVRDERGVSAMEYAILAGIVVIALVAAGSSFSTSISGLWAGITGAMNTATPH